MVHAAHDGFALGDQAGDHQGRAGAQIGGHHRGAGEHLDAAHDRRVAVRLDVGAHAQQLGHVHEAILEDGFGEHASAPRAGHQGHELRLHVGREAGVRRGRHVDAAQGLFAADAHVLAFALDLQPGLAQLHDHRLQIVERAALEQHVAARRADGGHECARLDAVGDDRVIERREARPRRRRE